MAFYTPLLAHNGYDIVMLKATSSPTTDGNWSEQDGSVRIGTGGGKVKSLWAVEHSSDIYVATQQEDDGRVRLHVFDPGTDAWTTKNEHVAEIGDHANFDSAPTIHGCSFAVRSDGDVLVEFTGHDDTGGDDDVFYIIRTGTTWGSVASVANSAWNPITIGPGSSDRITFIYTIGSQMRMVSISSADVLGTDKNLDTTIDAADLRMGPGIIDSEDTLYIPYIDSPNTISVAHFPSGADPAVSFHLGVGDNTVKGNGASAIPYVVACLAVDGTNVHLLYANDADQDIYHDDDVENGGTTDVEDQDAVTCNRISCAILGTNLDYVWLDGTTIKYNSIDIGAAPAFLPNGLMLVGVGR